MDIREFFHDDKHVKSVLMASEVSMDALEKENKILREQLTVSEKKNSLLTEEMYSDAVKFSSNIRELNRQISKIEFDTDLVVKDKIKKIKVLEHIKNSITLAYISEYDSDDEVYK